MISRNPIVILVGMFLFATGCYRAPSPLPPTISPLDADAEMAIGDSVISLLSAADQTALQEAFGRLAGYTYERETHVRQLDAAGAEVASSRTVVSVSTVDGDRRLRILSADSTGEFSGDVFGWFAERAVPREDTTALATQILPREPPYLKARGREGYVYRILPDSTAADELFRRCLIEAKPGEGDSQRIRQARVTIAVETNTVVSIHVTYDQQTLFYRERSNIGLDLGKWGTGVWLPRQLAMDTDVGSAFMARKRFSTVASFGQFERIAP